MRLLTTLCNGGNASAIHARRRRGVESVITDVKAVAAGCSAALSVGRTGAWSASMYFDWHTFRFVVTLKCWGALAPMIRLITCISNVAGTTSAMHVSRIGFFTTSGWVLACSHHVTLLHCNHLLAGSRFVIFEGLEPYEVKVSRTVLRGPGAGNRSRLPGAPGSGM